MAQDVADLNIHLGADTDDAVDGVNSVNKSIDDLANNPNFDKASIGLMGIGTAGLLGFTQSTFAAMDFETAIIDLGIATNTQGSELDDLKMTVLDLGAAFPYSANEVANLMTELAKLGFAGADLDLLTESTMNLATALGTELLPTGEAINAVLKSFNMSAENASEIADQMYRILAAGSLDLETLMNAWQYLGGVVDMAGLSFVEAGAFLSILTDRAIPAERAGRALKKLFTELMNPSEDLKTMLSSLGIAFTDLDGNMLGVKDIIFNIIDAWQGLSKQEQIDLATMLVGTEFMDVAIALFDSGREAWDKFMESYNGAISIVDAVKMKMESAKQIWETFKETIANISIVVGEQLLPAFKSIVSHVTNVADKITTLDPSLLKVIALVGSLGSGFMLLSGFLGMASKNMGVVTTGLRILLRTATGPVGVVMLLAGAFIYAYQHSETFRNIVDSVVDKLVDFGSRALSTTNTIRSFISTNDTAKTALEALGIAAGVVVAAFVGFQIISGITTAINVMKIAMLGLNASFLANPIVLVVAAIAALAAGVYFAYQKFEPFRNVVDTVWAALKNLGEVVGGGIATGIRAIGSAIDAVRNIDLGALVQGGWNVIKGGIQAAWNAITSLTWSDFVPKLAWVDWIAGKISDIATWVWDKISGFFPSSNVISGSISSIGTWLWGKIKDYFPAANVIENAIVDFGEWLWGKISGLFPTIPDFEWPSASEIFSVISGFLKSKILGEDLPAGEGVGSGGVKSADYDKSTDWTNNWATQNYQKDNANDGYTHYSDPYRPHLGGDEFISPASIASLTNLKAAIDAANTSMGSFNTTQSNTGKQSELSFGQIGTSSKSNVSPLGSMFSNIGQQMMSGWNNSMGLMASSTMTNMSSINDTAYGYTSTAKSSVSTNANAMSAALSGQMLGMSLATKVQMALMSSTASTQLGNMTSSTKSETVAMAAAMTGGMAATAVQLTLGASRWAGIISTAGASAISVASSTGYSIGAGVAAGLWAALGLVTAAASAIVAQADRAIRAKAQIHSPARMFMYHGEMMGAGVVAGIESVMGDVARAGVSLTEAAIHDPNIAFGGSALGGGGYTALSSPGTVIHNNQTYNVTVSIDDLSQYEDAAAFFGDLDVQYALNTA